MGTKQIENESSPIALAREIFKISHILRDLLYWALFVFILMMVFIVFSVAYLFAEYNEVLLQVAAFSVFFCFILMLYIPFNLKDIIKAIKSLKNWDDKYLVSAYLTMFEFVPRGDQEVVRDVVSRLIEVHPWIKEEVAKRGNVIQYDAIVEGKTSKHRFDATITRGKKREFSVFVRFFNEQNKITSIENIKTFHQDVEDVVRKRKMEVFEIVGVSSSDYSDETIEFVSDKANWIKDISGDLVPINLIKVIPEGFRIVWMEYGA